MKQTGTVLMVWEHSEIQLLATHLGAKNVSAWGKDDFDSICVITYQKDGFAVLAPDKEGIPQRQAAILKESRQMYGRRVGAKGQFRGRIFG